MVGKTDIEFISDEIGLGSVTEMGGFALEKGPEAYLAPEPFQTSIFTSSTLVGAADK